MPTWSNTRPRLPLPARELFVSPPSFLAFEPVMVRLAQQTQVAQLEHRPTLRYRDDVVHFGPAAARVVGELAGSLTRPHDLPHRYVWCHWPDGSRPRRRRADRAFSPWVGPGCGRPQWHSRVVGIRRTGTPSPGAFFFWEASARSGIVGRPPRRPESIRRETRAAKGVVGGDADRPWS
jgi:hypothetical protein